MNYKEKWYEYWFSCVKGISSERKRQIRKFCTAKELYYIEEIGLEFISDKELERLKESRKKKRWEEEFAAFPEKGIQFLSCMDENYPSVLKDFRGMPYAIYFKGKLPEKEDRTIGIVGARRCSPYGERMTLKFAEELAQNGIMIVSGMARGVDGIAHRGALNVGGKTIAVLGCGIDICYPREHQGLYQDIEKGGSIVSEYPPGTPPLPAHFPARNRIISALSEVVLVMEAKEKSGSLITADMALEQGKDVFALPGTIESELSRGCNRLIYQGAGILLGTEEFMEELKINRDFERSLSAKKRDKNKIMLETSENLVYSCLGFYPKGREEILNETKLLPQELMRILVALELKGYIKKHSNNQYIRSE